MELSHLRAFIAVSRATTIAGAAEELHVTPSPLSRTIRELERQLGRELFVRSYHAFTLTEFGSHFLSRAVEVVAQADEAELFAKDAHPPLRIGATPWTSRSLTERLMRTARERSDEIADLRSDLSSVLLRAMRHGDLDMALVHLPVEEPGIATAALAKYSHAVAAVGQPGLEKGRPLRLDDLRGRNVLSFPLVMQPAPMQAFRDTLMAAGIETIHEIDLRELVGLQSRMAQTGELMLVTTSKDLPTARFLDLDEMQVYPLADGQLEMEVGLAWRTRDSVQGPLIRRIVDELRPAAPTLPYLK